MRILVIDDNQLHQQSARQTLKGHDLTIVGTYDEAYELLEINSTVDQKLILDECERRYGPAPKWDDMTEEERMIWPVRYNLIHEELLPPGDYDAVLCDLLMPASKREMAGKGLGYVGQEMPVGLGLVLMAVRAKAKYAAVVTATSHHQHPAAAMLDPFLSRCPHKYDGGSPPRFLMNGTRVGYYAAPFCWLESSPPCVSCGGNFTREPCDWFQNEAKHPEGCGKCHGSGMTHCGRCNGSGLSQTGKDWGLVLKALIDCK